MGIGNNIQHYRKKAGLTQKQLAERVGLATGTIQQYELGKREPRIEQLEKIADALRIDEAELYGKDAWLLIVKGTAEAHHVYESMGYSFSKSEKELVVLFNRLNEFGKETAIERIGELTELHKYINQEGR